MEPSVDETVSYELEGQKIPMWSLCRRKASLQHCPLCDLCMCVHDNLSGIASSAKEVLRDNIAALKHANREKIGGS